MATLKNTAVIATGSLQLPIGTTAQRLTPQSAHLRYNSTLNKIERYDSSLVNWTDIAYLNIAATGGNSVYDVDTDGTTFRVHVFTTVGDNTFTVTRGGQVEYLIVGGGGGGSGNFYDDGAGGGAGGVITGFTTVTPQAYTITVGAGGAWGDGVGIFGGNTVAFGLTALGGGGGASHRSSAPGGGGSGGGGGGSFLNDGLNVAGGPAGQPVSASGGFGNAGGNGGINNTLQGGGYPGSGGGGGAGAPGRWPLGGGADQGGEGGSGLSFNISGTNNFYAGGGGGLLGGRGGIGGGANASGGRGTAAAIPATPNTGAGGGGGRGSGDSGIGSAGGSGIVIIRYPVRQKGLTTSVRKIRDSSLILAFDFAAPDSYPGVGDRVFGSEANSSNGILINGPTVRDFRTHRSSFRFNGSNQYINAGNLELRRNWTLEMWARRNGDVDFSAFGHGPAVTNQGLHILYTTGSRGMVFGFNGNDADYQGNYRPAGGIWQHWVFTYNHSTFAKQFYANGVLQTPGSIVQNQYAGTGQFNIGAIYSTALGFANGEIGVANVYSRILSLAEIQQNYEASRWRFGL